MNSPTTRKSNIVVQEFASEVLIYDLSINKAFCLNQTAALVYELADGTRTESEISEIMGFRLNIFVSEEVVKLALDQFKKDNLLENADELPNNFTGLTRREAIRRVGLGSMVLLPIISSIIAPQAVLAVSCVGMGTVPPGGLLPGCYGSQLECNANAPLFCCNGQAGTVIDTMCGAPGAADQLRCPCATTP